MTWRSCAFLVFTIILSSSCASHLTGVCVATITHPGGKGKPCVLEYRVDGERFVSFGPRLPYLVAGEHFQLLYNKQKPWKHKLLTDKQVFLDSEQTGFIEGRVLRCVNGTFTRVFFTYTVNGKQYKKKQIIQGVTGLQKSDHCFVQFSIDTPRKAILIGRNITAHERRAEKLVLEE